MRFVVDASVVVKWIFPDRPEESHTPLALSLLESIRSGDVDIRQPPHWMAEVAAVCVRMDPQVAEEAVILLTAMEFQIVETVEVYKIACHLSKTLSHHLFDTLYHAVALSSPEITLITADMQYYRKAKNIGAILPLSDLPLNLK